jgi:uncharacterized protein YciI
MIYESDPANLPRAREVFPAHRALLDEYHSRGTLLMAGPLVGDEQARAFGIWASRAEAEEFMSRDPFVTTGIVARRELKEWNEVLAP